MGERLMPRPFTPKVITSNHLLEGDVIYLSPTGEWVRNFTKAELFTNPEVAETRLKIADQQRNIHVGAYLADAVMREDGTPEPVHFRERFRTKGPSNYFHGKQAE